MAQGHASFQQELINSALLKLFHSAPLLLITKEWEENTAKNIRTLQLTVRITENYAFIFPVVGALC